MAVVSKQTEKVLLIVAGVAVVVVAFGVFKAGEKIKQIVTTDLNPIDEDNLVNRGVSFIVESATDGQFDNLGKWFYCKTHPEVGIEICPK